MRRRTAFGCFALLGLLPWLGTRFVPAGVVIGVFAVRSLLRARRRTLAVGRRRWRCSATALYVAINQAVYGGPTPYAADVEGETPTGASFPAEHLAADLPARGPVRGPRLRAAALGARVPAGLRGPAGCCCARGRDGLSRAVPDLRAGERVALMCAAALGAQVLMAAFLAPTMFGFWFPSRHLLAALPLAVPLVAWGLRRLPRVGTALAALSVAASAWLYFDVRLGDGGLVKPRPDAPFGPLTDLFPFFDDAAWPYALAGALGSGAAGLALLAARGASTASVRR